MHLANIDGTICDAAEATVPVSDRGFLYGDSVYEVIRTYNGRPFAFAEHMDRLQKSAHRLDLPLPKRDWLEEEIVKTLNAAENENAYCRIMVTRGTGPLTLDPTSATCPRTVILVRPYEPFPEWMYERGIKVLIPKIRRNPPAALDPAIKSGNYLNSILALGEAKKAGFEDALMLGVKGRVAEATSATVFVVKSGTLCTPALDTGILEGITRATVLEIAARNDIRTAECDLYPEDLTSADEVMLTSTLREVMPVTQVNDNKVGDGTPGPLAGRLRSWFRAHALKTIHEKKRGES